MFEIDNSAKKPKTNTNSFIIKVNKTNKSIRPKKLEQPIQKIEPAKEEVNSYRFIIY